MFMRRIISVMAACSMLVMLAGCGEADRKDISAADKEDNGEIGEYHFVMAEVNPIETIVGQTDKAFADKVEELSGGAMTVDLHCSSELGNETEIITAMIDGVSDVDICRVSAFQFNMYGCQMPTILSLPFTFEDEEHFWRFADSELAEEFLAEPLEYNLGVRGLLFGEEGFRHFFSDKEMKSLDDFKGARVRVSSDLVMTRMVEGFGSSTYQVQIDKIAESFKNDEIDAAEQPIVNYVANKYYEDAPYLLLDGHTLGVVEIIISEDVWQELSPAQQAVITEAADYAKEYNKSLVATKEDEAFKELEKYDVIINDVDDITPYREATKGVIESQIVGIEDLYQQVLDFAE